MRHTLIWANNTARSMRALRERDGDAVKPFADAVNALARNPRPPEAVQLGGTERGGYALASTGRCTRSTARVFPSRSC
ncbi:hypothetical protein [Streptomyces sp. NPDC001678]|uniref:hypothetical protein n=1 Tax=Streptomyces sp. NPDC001678 TaxID=3364599 RepID=UPI0036B44FCB